jgi:hypothetical protein
MIITPFVIQKMAWINLGSALSSLSSITQLVIRLQPLDELAVIVVMYSSYEQILLECSVHMLFNS